MFVCRCVCVSVCILCFVWLFVLSGSFPVTPLCHHLGTKTKENWTYLTCHCSCVPYLQIEFWLDLTWLYLLSPVPSGTSTGQIMELRIPSDPVLFPLGWHPWCCQVSKPFLQHCSRPPFFVHSQYRIDNRVFIHWKCTSEIIPSSLHWCHGCSKLTPSCLLEYLCYLNNQNISWDKTVAIVKRDSMIWFYSVFSTDTIALIYVKEF